jgi:hypothetical protein
MTTAPDEPIEPDNPIAPDNPEPAEAPDPVHEPDDEPRFAPEGEDDTPEVPMPDEADGS